MLTKALPKPLRLLALALAPLLLAGCEATVLAPSGDVAIQQRNLLVASTALMLLIIIPVMVLTALFAWHYREGNAKATFDPNFHHSTGLEVVIWSAPLLIIVALGALTWTGTHLLDPYRPLGRVSAGKPLVAEAAAKSGRKGLAGEDAQAKTQTAPGVAPGTVQPAAEPVKPLVIEAVALDWKWLFLYPEQGVASLNEVAAPVDRPVTFRITSSSVMNSLFIPALAGQIYAMPGMQTTLHAVINQPGEYEGFSAMYSGAGFSDMHFMFHGLDQAGFEAWAGKVRAEGGGLSREDYLQLERPSRKEPVRYFKDVPSDLYDAILNRCVDPVRLCVRAMAAIDARGGGGREGLQAVVTAGPDPGAHGGGLAAAPAFVAAICTAADSTGRGRMSSLSLNDATRGLD